MQHVSLATGLLVASGALLWAALSDLRRYIIPNRACLLVAGAYVTALAWTPISVWLAGVGAGAAALALGAVLFARGWLGGGDVKLAAATALWAGPAFMVDFALVTSLAGAALSAVMLSPLRRLLPRPDGTSAGLKQPMPFGAPLAAGGAWVLILQFVTYA